MELQEVTRCVLICSDPCEYDVGSALSGSGGMIFLIDLKLGHLNDQKCDA